MSPYWVSSFPEAEAPGLKAPIPLGLLMSSPGITLLLKELTRMRFILRVNIVHFKANLSPFLLSTPTSL